MSSIKKILAIALFCLALISSQFSFVQAEDHPQEDPSIAPIECPVPQELSCLLKKLTQLSNELEKAQSEIRNERVVYSIAISSALMSVAASTYPAFYALEDFKKVQQIKEEVKWAEEVVQKLRSFSGQNVHPEQFDELLQRIPSDSPHIRTLEQQLRKEMYVNEALILKSDNIRYLIGNSKAYFIDTIKTMTGLSAGLIGVGAILYYFIVRSEANHIEVSKAEIEQLKQSIDDLCEQIRTFEMIQNN